MPRPRTHKPCSVCKDVKPVADFGIYEGRPKSACRACERARQRAAWRALPIEERRRRMQSRTRSDNLEYKRAYVEKNRAAIMEQHRAYRERRFFWGKTQRLKGEGKATPRQLAAIWKAQRGRCALTGRRLDRTAQLDHKTPRARGGDDTAGNLQWLCRQANLAKRDLTDAEFYALCAEVVCRAAPAPLLRIAA